MVERLLSASAFTLLIVVLGVVAVATAQQTASPSLEDFQSGQAVRITLVEVASGEATSLVSSAGGVAGGPHFSSDGRWLAFSHGRSYETSSVFRLDLSGEPNRAERLGPGSNPVIAPDGRAVVFHRIEGDEFSLHLWREDGSTTRLADAAVSPSWSPDGRWLAYRGPYGGEDRTIEYVLVDAHSLETRVVSQSRVCHCDTPYAAKWSPDSGFLAVPRPVQGSGLVALKGQDLPEVDFVDAWLPDARGLIWRRYPVDPEAPGYDVLLLSPATGRSLQLLNAAQILGELFLSPDGTRIAYEAAGQGSLAILDIASGRTLSPIREGFFHGWSADGRYLTAYSEGGGPACGREFLLYNVEGDALPDCLSGIHRLSWSPLGAEFVYLKRAAAEGPQPAFADLFLFDAATGQSRLLVADVAAGCFQVEWSPDGRFLAVGPRCQL